MKTVLIIPARYQSTRFPGKPLLELAGKSMTQRVYEQCAKAYPAEQIYVATEDVRILSHCESLGIQAILTSDNCLTGTDRVAEVALQIDAEYYINVQGDEPVFNPNDITVLLNVLPRSCGSILNGYCEIDNDADYRSVSVPKVVFRRDERLLYMSRSAIPGNKRNIFNFGYRQVCVYAFPKDALLAFKNYSVKTPFEEQEDIEILRFLEMGYDVQMIKMSKDSIPIDNPEDIEKVLKRIADAE
ncbi:MAG: 3-deoxy-manno-octulosonate cytidylyltransferase [Ferruginibacter sp.]|nr:3-deoxy-manno-octulosonate cytidylyltransferase [Ferruginibacter sp.]